MLVASIVVLGLLAGGIAYLVLSEEDEFPSSWDDRVEPLAAWVASERGLEFEHPVEVNFLSESEYTAASTSEPSSEEDEAAVADAAAELRALGFVSGDFDLVGSMNTLNDSGTLAFYSSGTKEVYVRGETLTPALRVTLVHELVHVLQDQHFDLSRMSEMSSTRAGVLRAIAEGDAGRIEDVYVDEELTDAEREEYRAESDASGEESAETVFEEVPDALTALFAAPYVFGEPLVTYLLDVEGQGAIDEALKDPPSEQVLFNPFLWHSPEAEEVELEVITPSGTTEINRDDVGPIAWYLVLAGRLEPRDALAAVDGLGGDTYVTYRDGQRVCMRATLVGDGPTETSVLESALNRWVQAGPAEVASVMRDDDENLQFQACDPGADAAPESGVTLDVLALPVTRTSIYMDVRDTGASETEGWCVADGFMSVVTMEQLMASGDDGDQTIGALMADVMLGCGTGG